jgi:hypothetical protein
VVLAFDKSVVMNALTVIIRAYIALHSDSF